MLRQQFPWCAAWEDDLRALFDAYVAAKQRQKVLDYDDLLLYWAELMKVPELAREVGGQFDHILFDEYQDTNALQATILLGLKPDGHGLTVVGDDAQTIYGFRAANVRNILDFPTLFDPPATLVTLEQNYRSTQAILGAANAVIGLAAERFTTNLYSDRLSNDVPTLVTVLDDSAQAAFIATTVLENREAGIPLKRQAVLFRTASHSAMLEIALTRRNIPFVKFGGLKFIEAAHVKDLLAVMRWIENPADRVSGFRVLQLIDGIGPTSAGKVLDSMSGAYVPWSSNVVSTALIRPSGASVSPNQIGQVSRGRIAGIRSVTREIRAFAGVVTCTNVSSVSSPLRHVSQITAFFQKPKFERLLGDDLLEAASFAAQILRRVCGCRPCRIARQPPLAGLEKLLRPTVVQAFRDAFAPAQFGNADFTAQAVEHDADLFFRRILLARCLADVANKAF